MAIDRNRGTFVKDEWRYEVVENPAVKAVQDQARVIKLDTNLNLSAAALLAAEIMAEQGPVSQAYNVTLQGIDAIKASDFIGSPPTFLCNFPDWPVDLTDKLKVVSITRDGENMITTVLIKGAIK